MDNNSQVMLDLETLGNGPQALIIAIGAVKFNCDGLQEEFYTVVDAEDAAKQGLKIDASTVLWWMKQSDQARAAFDRPGVPLGDALFRFSNWLGADQPIWGNGAAFDNVILRNAYEACKLPAPWNFWSDRCYRTVKSLNPQIKMQRTGTYHNALDDAKSQALHLIEMLK